MVIKRTMGRVGARQGGLRPSARRTSDRPSHVEAKPKTAGGWRVTLHATGLPRLANGRFYEAWLKNPKGVLVPIGTFNQPTNITLWAGVPPTQFPTLTITRQQANGNPASSGQRVLVGKAKAVS